MKMPSVPWAAPPVVRTTEVDPPPSVFWPRLTGVKAVDCQLSCYMGIAMAKKYHQWYCLSWFCLSCLLCFEPFSRHLLLAWCPSLLRSSGQKQSFVCIGEVFSVWFGVLHVGM